VAAFRATLEEILEADLLLHVVDITHLDAPAQAQAVRDTLDEIGVLDIPMVTALNKIDLLETPEAVVDRIDEFERAVPISATTGEGIAALLTVVEQELQGNMVWCDVFLPYQEGRLISLFHEHGIVERVEHTAEGVRLTGRLPGTLVGDLRPWLKSLPVTQEEESPLEEPAFDEDL